jgi:hypothetical protein
MNIDITEQDFNRLCESSMPWKAMPWQEQEDRFETTPMDAEIDWDRGYVYWVGPNPAAMILAREYIKSQGFDVQVLWDMAEVGEDFMGYALVTDFATDNWKRHTDGIVIRVDAGHTSDWYDGKED